MVGPHHLVVAPGGSTRSYPWAVSANAVPGFRPSTCGFHFANRFPPVPALWYGIGYLRLGIGNAADGLCGGMCFAVRDRFERGESPPVDALPPAPGADLFREIAHRQVASFDRLRVPLRFYALAALHPSPSRWWSRLLGRAPRQVVAVRDEWPKIRADIDAGRLSMVGVVRSTSANPFRLGHNHQVMAWGYEVTPERLVLRLYDPNWPDRDDVEVRVTLGAAHGHAPRSITLEQSTGEPLASFFRAPYRG